MGILLEKNIKILGLLFVQMFCLFVLFGCSQDNKTTLPAIDTGGWVTLGNAIFPRSNTFSFVISDGVPYLAGHEEDGRPSVVKYINNQWEYIGARGFSDEIGDPFLYVYKGIPYVAFKRMRGSLLVMKFNGVNWESLNAETTPLIEGDNILLDNARDVHLSGDEDRLFLLFSLDGKRRTYVLEYKNASWEVCGQRSIPGINSKLAVHKGRPYALSLDEDGWYLKTNLGGVGWYSVGGERAESDSVALFPALCFSVDDAFFAFTEHGIEIINPSRLKKISDSPSLTSVWEVIDASELAKESVEVFSCWYNHYDNCLYIAGATLSNGQKAIVLKYDGIKWEYVGAKGFSNHYALWPVLQFCDNNVYIAFNDDEGITVMKYTITP
jgi:hypothetical protein